MHIMEFASRLRWILVIAAGLIFLVLVGWGLFSIAKDVFNSSGSSSSPTSTGSSESFAVTDAKTARFTTQGPVVANQDYNSYTIEVSGNVVSMKVFKNYTLVLTKQVSYANNAEAYRTFLNAVEVQGVTDRKNNTDTEDDYEERGVCATGKRYIFELDSSIRRWSTSCDSKQGTANFSVSAVRSLFQKQVPEFSELVSGTGL